MARTDKNIKYSVVIPVYNSASILKKLHAEIVKIFEKNRKSFEIIFVEDCGPDKSWELLKELRKKDQRLKVIQLYRNFGQHNALICGLSFASGEYVLTMDDDLQHPPEEIPKLIAKIEQGYDLVYGRYLRKEHNFWKNLGSKFINYILKKVTGYSSSVTSFRIMKKAVAQKIIKHKNYNIMIDVCISDFVSRQKIAYVAINHSKRLSGKSNYTLRKLVSMAINMILNYSTLPLKIASILGIFSSVLSFLVAVYLIIVYFTIQNHVSGWTSLILAIVFFSGLILFVIGIIGEYISRIFLNLSDKPQYEIREIL